jgi:hypothetical protein
MVGMMATRKQMNGPPDVGQVTAKRSQYDRHPIKQVVMKITWPMIMLFRHCAGSTSKQPAQRGEKGWDHVGKHGRLRRGRRRRRCRHCRSQPLVHVLVDAAMVLDKVLGSLPIGRTIVRTAAVRPMPLRPQGGRRRICSFVVLLFLSLLIRAAAAFRRRRVIIDDRCAVPPMGRLLQRNIGVIIVHSSHARRLGNDLVQTIGNGIAALISEQQALTSGMGLLGEKRPNSAVSSLSFCTYGFISNQNRFINVEMQNQMPDHDGTTHSHGLFFFVLVLVVSTPK